MPTTPPRSPRKQKPSIPIPIAERIQPRAAPHRRQSADLALALVVGWQRGYDFSELFPPPHNLYEIADIIQFFIQPLIHRDREMGGPRVAAALHWIAVVRLCNFGKTTEEITDRQMHEGIWEEATGMPCDLGSGFRPRANRDARDVLRRLGLVRFVRTSNCLVATLIIDSVLRLGADAVAAAMRRRHGPGRAKARIEQLARVIGKEQADQIGKEQADVKTQEKDPQRETKDLTDYAAPNGATASTVEDISGASDGSQPVISTKLIRWLVAEGGDLNVDRSQLAARAADRLAGASTEDIRRAHWYADDWRRRARAHREEPALDQLVALATAGSLPAHRLAVMEVQDANPTAAGTDVERLLAGLHPLWVAGRFTRIIARRDDLDDPWSYLVKALSNRAEHDLWVKDRRAAIIEKEKS